MLLTANVFAQNRAADHARAGWEAIRAGRHNQAAEAFRASIHANSREPTVHFGAGLAAFLMGEPRQAQQELEEALRLAPELTEASTLLGEVLYRGNDLNGAIRVYEDAAAYAPGHRPLIARLDEWRKQASLDREFFQSQGTHFTVLFDGPSDEPLAAKTVEILEQAYWRIGSALSTFPDQNITVVLYTEEQFRDVTRSPDWTVGVFDGRIKLPVRGALQRTHELERILSHEFTHVLIRSIAPRGVPTWLNEGLAIAFEASDDTPRRRSRQAADEVRLSARRLASGFRELSGDEARAAYSQSAVATQALIDRQGTPAIVALLHDIARGEPFIQSFEYRMLMRYSEFLPLLGGQDTGGVQ